MFWLLTFVILALVAAGLSWWGRPRGSVRRVSGDIDERAHLTRGKDEGRNFYGHG